MARKWTDPTIMLIAIVPYTVGCIGCTCYLANRAFKEALPFIKSGSMPKGDELTTLLAQVAFVFIPYAVTVLWWTGLYHGWFEDKSVDTTKYVTFREPGLAKYYKHRKIPMCEFYEHYISEQCDFNQACEGGDCYLILHKHRHSFVNFKTTWRQISWLFTQFFPAWMTCGRGLGQGSSSGKSIEETTKEIDEHYNKGNDVFSCILGTPMVYTCGIFHKMPRFASDFHKGDYAASRDDGELVQAQFNKMNMICNKLMLKKGETLLDIGCGWGTLLRHAVSEFGAKATGVTLSREGKIYCDMASERQKIPTEVLLTDYRLIPENQKYDKVSCIEMAEHVGIKNFVDPYLKKVRGLMKNKDSMFMMQVAGLRQGSNWQDVAWGLFMVKYVFPGADASTPLNWYVRQLELAGFEVHSVENIGIHYSHTLHKWYDNWMSHKEEILAGTIDAISEHSKGTHLFRLNEICWAWCTIHAGQAGGTCYQILCNPAEYDFPRNQWVDGKHVSSDTLTGVGLNQTADILASKAMTTATPNKKKGSVKKPTTTPVRVQPTRSTKTPK